MPQMSEGDYAKQMKNMPNAPTYQQATDLYNREAAAQQAQRAASTPSGRQPDGSTIVNVRYGETVAQSNARTSGATPQEVARLSPSYTGADKGTLPGADRPVTVVTQTGQVLPGFASQALAAKIAQQQKEAIQQSQAAQNNPNFIKITEERYNANRLNAETERYKGYGYSQADSEKYARGNIDALNKGERTGQGGAITDIKLAHTVEEANTASAENRQNFLYPAPKSFYEEAPKMYEKGATDVQRPLLENRLNDLRGGDERGLNNLKNASSTIFPISSPTLLPNLNSMPSAIIKKNKNTSNESINQSPFYLRDLSRENVIQNNPNNSTSPNIAPNAAANGIKTPINSIADGLFKVKNWAKSRAELIQEKEQAYAEAHHYGGTLKTAPSDFFTGAQLAIAEAPRVALAFVGNIEKLPGAVKTTFTQPATIIEAGKEIGGSFVSLAKESPAAAVGSITGMIIGGKAISSVTPKIESPLKFSEAKITGESNTAGALNNLLKGKDTVEAAKPSKAGKGGNELTYAEPSVIAPKGYEVKPNAVTIAPTKGNVIGGTQSYQYFSDTAPITAAPKTGLMSSIGNIFGKGLGKGRENAPVNMGGVNSRVLEGAPPASSSVAVKAGQGFGRINVDMRAVKESTAAESTPSIGPDGKYYYKAKALTDENGAPIDMTKIVEVNAAAANYAGLKNMATSAATDYQTWRGLRIGETPIIGLKGAEPTVLSYGGVVDSVKDYSIVPKYGEVKGKVLTESNVLDPLRQSIAEAATKEGGYMGGSSAIEVSLPKGSFRKGVDVDIYFKEQSKVNPFSVKALEIAKGEYGKMGLNPENLQLKQATSHVKVVDTERGIDVADIGYRRMDDKVINVQGINIRDPSQIIADKRAIARLEKENIAKVSKAKGDIALYREARDIPNTKDITLYRGIYVGEEGSGTPIIGVTGKGKLVSGMPTAEQLPLENLLYPNLAKKNIATYPQTPLETAILARPEVMAKMGATESDILKVETTKGVLSASKNIRILDNPELPKSTKILGEETMTGIYGFLQKNPRMYERIYGSTVDVAQRPPEFRRTPGDIELEFKTIEEAKKGGESLIPFIKEKGAQVLEKEGKGLGIYVGDEKAIELKYHGDESTLELSKGARYGFNEYRGSSNLLGLKSQRYGEQMIRKGGASSTWWQSPNEGAGRKLLIEPPMHRPKDVVDFYAEIKSAVSKGKLPKSYEQSAEAWRNQEWRNPEVKTLFEEFDKNKEAYYTGMKIDLTEKLKSSKETGAPSFRTVAVPSSSPSAERKSTAKRSVLDTGSISPRGNLYTGSVRSSGYSRARNVLSTGSISSGFKSPSPKKSPYSGMSSGGSSYTSPKSSPSSYSPPRSVLSTGSISSSPSPSPRSSSPRSPYSYKSSSPSSKSPYSSGSRYSSNNYVPKSPPVSRPFGDNESKKSDLVDVFKERKGGRKEPGLAIHPRADPLSRMISEMKTGKTAQDPLPTRGNSMKFMREVTSGGQIFRTRGGAEKGGLLPPIRNILGRAKGKKGGFW